MPDLIIYQSPDDVAELLPAAWYEVAEQAQVPRRLSYTKAEILLLYADVAYFGHGYYGLAAASCGYFAERQDRLSWAQAALLAGLVQAPAADDPLSHFANARARQAHVLVRLIGTGKLTRQQAARAYQMPLHLTRGHAGGC